MNQKSFQVIFSLSLQGYCPGWLVLVWITLNVLSCIPNFRINGEVCISLHGRKCTKQLKFECLYLPGNKIFRFSQFLRKFGRNFSPAKSFSRFPTASSSSGFLCALQQSHQDLTVLRFDDWLDLLEMLVGLLCVVDRISSMVIRCS